MEVVKMFCTYSMDTGVGVCVYLVMSAILF